MAKNDNSGELVCPPPSLLGLNSKFPELSFYQLFYYSPTYHHNHFLAGTFDCICIFFNQMWAYNLPKANYRHLPSLLKSFSKSVCVCMHVCIYVCMNVVYLFAFPFSCKQIRMYQGSQHESLYLRAVWA